MEKPKRMTPAGMRARGWTPAMITRLLGEPDAIAPNPHYEKAAPMRLYDLSRIEAAEACSAFGEAREAADRRSAASTVIAARKGAELLDEIRAVTVRLQPMPLEMLIDAAIASYNLRNDRPGFTPVGRTCDGRFLQRIAVNHARHCFTTYDERLEALFGRIGARRAWS